MSDFRPADHAMGLELQLEELAEQQARATVQGRTDDAAPIGREIDRLQAELAETADRLAREGGELGPEPRLQFADELSAEEPGN